MSSWQAVDDLTENNHNISGADDAGWDTDLEIEGIATLITVLLLLHSVSKIHLLYSSVPAIGNVQPFS